MNVWIAVTHDKYELPYAVADSARELAQMLGISYKTIQTTRRRYRLGETKYCRYQKVTVDDE